MIIANKIMMTGSASPLLVSSAAGRETAMVKDMQGEAGLHLDEMSKLGVLDPEVIQQTVELREEQHKDFWNKTGQIQKIVGGSIEVVDHLVKEAENEKMKVIGV